MADGAITTGTILGEGAELARLHAGMLAGTGAAIAGGYSALDLMGAAGATTAINLVVSVMGQYLVLERLLADRIVPEAKGKRRYGSLFGASLLSGAGIMLGFILLVLPGLYLSGRWLSSSPYVVAGGKRAGEALGASWAASETSQAAHVFAALISGVPIALLLLAGVVGGEAGLDIDGVVATLAINVLTALSSLMVWVLAAAAYRVEQPFNAGLNEVFA